MSDLESSPVPGSPNHPVIVSDATFDDEVLGAEVPVLVDFWAAWCGPCRMIAPTLEALAKDHVGHLKVVKYNTEQNRAVAEAMHIRALPTLVLFKDGEVADVQIGALPPARLDAWVRRHLEPRKSLLDRLLGR
jgi:thioredoxin